ncbi:TOM (translocase of outer membrane) complex component [Coemansia sp. RSA 788]|nr:TOM (translocase of outer membrane) complex component [Coemansia sp. RSA 1824]KAJ2135241.1 TOM (translocase of outer membrane) complex component [Coemansia sp. RSA 788]KAJ2143110.1 TOM (translocase of outer membrane) complex component [Coemansia sp. RSA 564]KAJ2196850.1 TOM (translocase of outer membrane) complex component [Coemansia sp. RSA 530]KAJ2405700.1 TOM (translocase of outer membrane) complex component [Coemansia sp. RSA 2526]KAJ2833927.1 TOM (translocase of outer membrane) complex
MTDNAGDKAVQKSASMLEKLNLNERSWKFYAAASIPPALVAGLALWYYSSRSSESTKKDDKKKRPRKGKKAKKSKSADDSAEEKSAAASAAASTASLDANLEAPESMTDAQIDALNQEAQAELAQSLKSRGNKFFQAKRYEKAIELYTQALRFAKDPVFYSNRAACYAASSDHEKVIQDCTSALELESRYVKALIRRAQAFESTEKFRDSLYDFTTACILEDFGNNLAATSAERVLKKLAEAEAHERVEKRSPRLPSKSFISGYLNSFRNSGEEAVATDGENLSEADALFNEALSFTALQEYSQAIDSVEKAVAAVEKTDGSDVQRVADIYSLRGMFNFLKSNLDQALEDLNKALVVEPSHVRSYLRKANLFTEKKDLEEVSSLLDQAHKADSENAETFFQQGQVHFLKQEFEAASNDYKRAAELDPDFVYPRIQLGVVQFKVGKIEEAMATFDEAMKKFPTRSDLYNYYGEVLAEQGGYDSAIGAFEKAIELDSTNPLPYVNQAISLFQTSGQPDRALTLIREALKVDPECELAVAALSQIYLQMGMFEESLAMLRRAVDLAKSEEEMISAITFRETTAAQFRFMKEHPELLSKMMGGGM